MGAAVELVMKIFESLQCFLLCKVPTKYLVQQEMSARSCVGIEDFVLDSVYLLPQIVSDRPHQERTPRQSLLSPSSCCLFDDYPYSQAGIGVIASLKNGWINFLQLSWLYLSYSLCCVTCAPLLSKLEGHIRGKQACSIKGTIRTITHPTYLLRRRNRPLVDIRPPCRLYHLTSIAQRTIGAR